MSRYVGAEVVAQLSEAVIQCASPITVEVCYADGLLTTGQTCYISGTLRGTANGAS
jgi:hypothetical protein